MMVREFRAIAVLAFFVFFGTESASGWGLKSCARWFFGKPVEAAQDFADAAINDGFSFSHDIPGKILDETDVMRFAKQIQSVSPDPAYTRRIIDMRLHPEAWVENAEAYWQREQRLSADIRSSAELFKNYMGFNPTPENFIYLHKIAKEFGPFKLKQKKHTYSKYKNIDEISYPEGFPSGTRTAVDRIRTLWNSPRLIISYMREIKNMVAEKARNESISEQEAMEKLRIQFEQQNGFGDPRLMQNILPSAEWHQLLRDKIPTTELNGAHAFDQNPGNSKNIHRDQWLVVMMDMQKNPELYGQFREASDLYAEFGNDNRDSPDHFFHHQSLWFQLFDYVDVKVANAASPYYFHELWKKITGFPSHY